LSHPVRGKEKGYGSTRNTPAPGGSPHRVALLGAGSSAQAGFKIRFSVDGNVVKEIADNGTGEIDYTGNLGSNNEFTVKFAYATTNAPPTSSPTWAFTPSAAGGRSR
jgi:hypothetical protein